MTSLYHFILYLHGTFASTLESNKNHIKDDVRLVEKNYFLNISSNKTNTENSNIKPSTSENSISNILNFDEKTKNCLETTSYTTFENIFLNSDDNKKIEENAPLTNSLIHKKLYSEINENSDDLPNTTTCKILTPQIENVDNLENNPSTSKQIAQTLENNLNLYNNMSFEQKVAVVNNIMSNIIENKPDLNIDSETYNYTNQDHEVEIDEDIDLDDEYKSILGNFLKHYLDQNQEQNNQEESNFEYYVDLFCYKLLCIGICVIILAVIIIFILGLLFNECLKALFLFIIFIVFLTLFVDEFIPISNISRFLIN